MAINISQIPPFSQGTNPAEAWATWRRDFDFYLKALKYHKEDQDTQIALFVHVCGPELKKLYRNMQLELGNANTPVSLKEVLDRIDKHFEAYKNEMYASFVFWKKTDQSSDEPFDHFLTRVRHQADECDFGQLTYRMIRDKLVHSIYDSNLRERLLRKTRTLEYVINDCKSV